MTAPIATKEKKIDEEEEEKVRDEEMSRKPEYGEDGDRDGVGDGEEEEEEEDGDDDGEDREIDMNLIRSMTQKLATEPVKVRVHDIKIKGNTKTKDSVIEAQLQEVRAVESMQELLQESVRANSRLRSLGVFDKCVITLDAGPNELPGTVNLLSLSLSHTHTHIHPLILSLYPMLCWMRYGSYE